MNEHQPTAKLLQQCIVRKESGPWIEFMERFRETIASTFRRFAWAPQRKRLAEFRDWLPAWLVMSQRLELALTKLKGKIAAGECLSDEDQELMLKNYLRDVFESGVVDFCRERSGRSAVSKACSLSEAEEEMPQARPDRIPPEMQHTIARIEQELGRLPPGIRVPFRLQHFEGYGQFPSIDLEWIAEQSGLQVHQIEQRITDALAARPNAEFPLSAAFIGELCSIRPTADGRYGAVHQRFSRARELIKQRIQFEDKSQ